jgi:hypothetical protein
MQYQKVHVIKLTLRGSQLAELLKLTKIIVWDEAPMCHKSNMEALNTTLQDLKGNQVLFGGVYESYINW